MYNSVNYSIFTPDTFEIENKDEHNHFTSLGFQKMKSSTIVICTLVRDVAKNLPYIKKRVEMMGNRFLDYRILIVENDSNDGTRQKLHDWRKENPNVIILGCGINNENECSMTNAIKKTEGHGVDRKRIEKMVMLRNIYIDTIKDSELLSSFDYAAVWDLDIIGSVYVDGVANSIGHLSDRNSPAFDSDSMCAYGIYKWGPMKLYYDTYAHIDLDDQFHINLKTIHDLKKGFGVSYKRGEQPVRVKSCFGGFTIYKIQSLLGENTKYDMSSENNLECEHARLHKKMDNVFMNPSMIHMVLLNE